MSDNDAAKMPLLPLAPGACPECGRKHDPQSPHCWGEHRYQFQFLDKYGVMPSWGDAMAHCRQDVKANWTQLLLEEGVTAEELTPNKPL